MENKTKQTTREEEEVKFIKIQLRETIRNRMISDRYIDNLRGVTYYLGYFFDWTGCQMKYRQFSYGEMYDMISDAVAETFVEIMKINDNKR